ncbi:MAG: hypothetical protein R8G66_01750 [Cytophagales bacterium]|nr:hypothetical protein [Cytophagales bacterium]
MKNLIKPLLVLMAFLMTVELSAQITYYDATVLKAQLTSNKWPEDDATVTAILNNYIDTENGETIKSRIKQNNPFLKGFLSNWTSASTTSSVAGPSGIESLAGRVSGINVTNVATGVSRFLIERANEEVNILFFNKFKKFLEKNQEAATLFPLSTNFITNTEPFQYAILIQSFKEAFKEDIANLVTNMDGLFELEKYKGFGENFPQAYAGLAAAASVSKLANGASFPDVIKHLGAFDNPSSSGKATDLYTSIKLMSILSESVRSNVEGEGWVAVADINRDIIADNDTRQIFMGLIYERVQGLAFSDKQKVQDILDKARQNGDDFRILLGYFRSIKQKWDGILALQQEIKDKKQKNEKVEYMEYYNFFEANINVIEQLLDINSVITNLGGNPHQVAGLSSTKDYLQLMRKGNQIYKNVSEKNYSSAVLNFVIVYKAIFGTGTLEYSDSKEQMKTFLAKKNVKFKGALSFKKGLKKTYRKEYLKDLGISVSQVNKQYKQNRVGISNSKFLKYATFMASVAEAEGPNDVKNILRAAALPAGGSSIKKNSVFNISLQSYLGLYYNSNHDRSISNAWNNELGVIAPIGVSLNWGAGKYGSVGVMASFFDLGAIVDYEIRRDTTTTMTTTTDENMQTIMVETETIQSETDYKVELGQIFSPGLYIVYGFGLNVPLTLGAGFQYGPGLTEINDANAIIGKPDWRLNIFMAFDIPIFTIINNSK